MLRRVALVRIDISEELSASIIRVTRIGELGTTLAVTSNRRTLLRNTVVPISPIRVSRMMEALRFSETSVLTRATQRNIPEDAILQAEKRSVTNVVIDILNKSLTLMSYKHTCRKTRNL
jgi:hypothetical protein